jgi:hypothetical protein
MAEFLRDIHIVDLNRSVIDEEKSDTKRGRLFFKKKTYIVDATYKDAQTRPPHKLEWAALDRMGHSGEDDNSAGVQTYFGMGYDFVTKNDPYYPEGATLNAEGHYVFMDAILMKCDFIAWLKRRARDMDKSNKAPQRAREAFVNSALDDETGEKLGFTKDQLKDMV